MRAPAQVLISRPGVRARRKHSVTSGHRSDRGALIGQACVLHEAAQFGRLRRRNELRVGVAPFEPGDLSIQEQEFVVEVRRAVGSPPHQPRSVLRCGFEERSPLGAVDLSRAGHERQGVEEHVFRFDELTTERGPRWHREGSLRQRPFVVAVQVAESEVIDVVVADLIRQVTLQDPGDVRFFIVLVVRQAEPALG